MSTTIPLNISHPIIRKLLRAVGIFCIPLIVGVVGFIQFEGLSGIDSLYMTVITMSTVGYETPAGGLSDPGKIFTVFLIIFTIGSFFYSVTTLTSVVVEGELRHFVKSYRVNKDIQKLKDHIIICGLGRNGRESALELMHHGDEFIVIERNLEVIDNFRDHHGDFLVLQGDASDEDLLIKANIKSAKGLILALSDDADNVFTTLTARELNPDLRIVSRASQESAISKLRRAGATRVILPNQLGGQKMARIIIQPTLVEFVDLLTGQGQFRLLLEEVDCNMCKGLIGKTLRELNIRSKTGTLVLGIRKSNGEYELNPPSDVAIKEDEKLFIIGTKEQLADFMTEFHH